MGSFTASPRLAHRSEDGRRTQTIQAHLEGTAQLAAQFAQPFGGQDQARLAGLLHDIGKYSDSFQRRLLEGGPKVDHSTAGAQIAQKQRQIEAAFAIAGHHGGLPDGGAKTDPAGTPTLVGRMKKSPPPCPGWEKEVTLPHAARPDFCRDSFTQAFYTRMLYSCLVDADYLDTEAFMLGQPPARGGGQSLPELLERLNRHLAQWQKPASPLNAQRDEILARCFEQGRTQAPGLFTLTVPTGGGKTLSSLAFALAHGAAHGKKRVIYVIPYTSIIDQNASLFAQILGEENVLEHHSGSEALLAEEKSGQADPKVLATENWDAPVVVTTAVQFFESLYSNRSSRCRKLHNLAQSVLIFDEAQTLPIPYLAPSVAAIGQLVLHYGATAVLCTATQPALGPLFARLAPGLACREIMEQPEALYAQFRRTTLCREGVLAQESLSQRLNREGQVLCVVNGRATAQQLYSQLPQEGRYCLTTLLCPAHRKALLAQIRERLAAGQPCRVVSTSLIEAGVDLDFPSVWREEAGLDSILQAAGRCNRNGKLPPEQALVRVFRLEGKGLLPLLRPGADAAEAVFRQFPDPAQLPAIQRYFTLLLQIKGAAALDRQGILRGFEKTMEGRTFPFATAAERFRLIESPAVTLYLALPQAEELIRALDEGRFSRSLYRRLGQYEVTVYPQHLAALRAAGAVDSPDGESWVLRDLSLYDPCTGLALDIPTGQGWMI